MHTRVSRKLKNYVWRTKDRYYGVQRHGKEVYLQDILEKDQFARFSFLNLEN